VIEVDRENVGETLVCEHSGTWAPEEKNPAHPGWTWLEPVAPPGTVARLEAERDEVTAALRDIAGSLAETGNGIVLQVPVSEGLAARIAGVAR